MKKNNRFIKPELEVIEFTNDDIITESITGNFGTPDPTDNDVFPKPGGWW